IELLQGDYRILKEAYGVSDLVHWTPALRAFVRTQASRVHLTTSGRAQQLIADLEDVDVPISLDLGRVRDQQMLRDYERPIAAADSVFVSVGAKAGDDHVEQLLAAVRRHGAAHAIATRGAAGASALYQGRLISVPSMLDAAAVVDTVGAGDAFI